ncbi:MAG: hypothetical protein WB697_19515 [Stellaceae bacterium]
MDHRARPAIRQIDRVSISGRSLALEAEGYSYQIDGVDPALAFKFLSACDGRASTEEICRREAIPPDVANAVIEASADTELICADLPARQAIPASLFLRILQGRYAVWNVEMFSQPLWRFLPAGKASRCLVDGWLLESYHFIRGAAARLSYATSLCHDERVMPYFLDHHLEEYDHYHFFEEALRRRKIVFADTTPLPSTEAIINFARMAARRGPLHYMACSGLLESTGSDAAHAVEFYNSLTASYDSERSGFIDPLVEHVLLDQAYGHGSICERILGHFDEIDVMLANDIIDTAAGFKDTIVYWFKDVYRTYTRANERSFAPLSREQYRASGRGFA